MVCIFANTSSCVAEICTGIVSSWSPKGFAPQTSRKIQFLKAPEFARWQGGTLRPGKFPTLRFTWFDLTTFLRIGGIQWVCFDRCWW